LALALPLPRPSPETATLEHCRYLLTLEPEVLSKPLEILKKFSGKYYLRVTRQRGSTPGGTTSKLIDRLDAIDAVEVSARPCGGWIGVGFVECVG
jgi:hypothetical protein